MVVMDPQTREVLALVGGYGYRPGGFDRRSARSASRARRSSRSSTRRRSSRALTPASILNDAPEVYEQWKPQNYEKEEFRGPVRLRVALAHSINTVPQGDVRGRRWPWRAPSPPRRARRADPARPGPLAGARVAVVTPLELANAYATFATGGIVGEPVLIARVGGEPQPPAPGRRRSTRGRLHDDLAHAQRGRGGHRARRAPASCGAPRPARPAPSNDQRDAWFVGFTPDLLAAVWVGFDDTRRSGGARRAARRAAPIWTDFMAKALASRPARDFVQPPGIIIQNIDPATGLLAAPGQESAPG